MEYQRARKDTEKDERRKAIIEASKRSFAIHGLAGTNIDRIAADCGLSRGLIYTYYLDKTHLFVVVVAEALESLYKEFEAQVARGGDGLDTLAAIGRSYARFAWSKPEYHDAILRFRFDGAIVPTERDGRKDRLVESFHADLERISARAGEIDALMVGQIERGMRDGSIRPVQDPHRVARALWAMVGGLLQSAAGDERLVETGIEIAQAGLRKGAAS